MHTRSWRTRALQLLAIIGFILALLLGGGAPHDFIVGGGRTAQPTATQTP